MMKGLFSILIAAVFLSGSAGLSLATHYCGGKVFKKQVMIDAASLGCGMQADMDVPCESRKGSLRKHCCRNVIQSLTIEDDYHAPTSEIELMTDFSLEFAFVLVETRMAMSADHPEYLYYSPPLLEKDIPVLVQSFRI